METIITVAFLFVSLALIALILIQHGKGADAGAAFGSGASSTVFGAQGAGNFLTRTTALLATAFFVLSLTLGWFAIHAKTAPGLVIDVDETTTEKTNKVTTDTDNNKVAIPEIPTDNLKATVEAVLPEIPKIPTDNLKAVVEVTLPKASIPATVTNTETVISELPAGDVKKAVEVVLPEIPAQNNAEPLVPALQNK